MVLGRVRCGPRPAAPARDQLGPHPAWARRPGAARRHRHRARARRADSAMGRSWRRSRISNRSSACGSRSRSSGRPSSSSARCSRRARTCCRRPGPPSSTLCTADVAPVPFDELLPQVEQALGRSPFEVFDDLEREPYAAASIAQVHRARLASGAPVILKIRRPGIEVKIDADLRILERPGPADGARDARGAALPAGRGGGPAAPLARARARPRGRGPQHRTLRAQLRR